MDFMNTVKTCGSLFVIVFTVWLCFVIIDARKIANKEKEINLMEKQNKILNEQAEALKKMRIEAEKATPILKSLNKICDGMKK